MGPLWSHCAASNRNDLQKQTVALNIFECVECEHRLEAAPKSAFDVWEQTVNYTAFDWPFSTNKLAKQIKWRRISGGNCVSFSKRVFCFLLNLQLLAWQKSRPINAKKCYNITIHSSSAFTLSAKCVAYHWCSKTPTHSSDRPTKNKMTKKQTIHANVLCILYSISRCKKNAEHTHRYNAHNEPPNRQPKICDRPVFTVRSFVYYDQQKKKNVFALWCSWIYFTYLCGNLQNEKTNMLHTSQYRLFNIVSINSFDKSTRKRHLRKYSHHSLYSVHHTLVAEVIIFILSKIYLSCARSIASIRTQARKYSDHSSRSQRIHAKFKHWSH